MSNEVLLDEEELEELEFLQGVPWQYHPLKQFLLDKLIKNDFPADYKLMGPFDVWNRYCDNDLFEGMDYDAAFKRRLLKLRKDFALGKDRANRDLNAFNIAKANHPAPTLNHRDEPQWNGSDAQRLLAIDMENKKHFDLKPEHLWESREEYQYFYLETFRNHIHQADQTRKYLNTLRKRKEDKLEELKEEALKREEAKIAKAKKAAEKETREAEKAAAKAKKEAEKKQQAEAKAAAKAAAKAKKEAEKKQKAETKEAEKKRKSTKSKTKATK